MVNYKYRKLQAELHTIQVLMYVCEMAKQIFTLLLFQ